MTDLARLVLDTDTRGLKDGAKQLDALSRSADRTARDAGASMNRLGQSIGGALRVGFLAAGAAAASAGAFFVKAGFDALKAADDIADAALRLGTTAEEYQKLTIAASKFGAEPEVVTGAIDKMNVSLGAFIQSGGGPAKDALERLGLASKVASGEIGNGTEAMYDIVDALAGVSSASERAAIANQIFGRSAGGTILELVGQGAAMREAGEEAQRTGRVMSDEMVAKLGAANNTIRDTKLAFSQMAQVLAGDVIISSMGFIDSLGPMIEQGRALAAQIGEFLGPSFKELAAAVVSLMSGPFGKVLLATLKVLATVIGTTLVFAIRVLVDSFTFWIKASDNAWRNLSKFIDNLVNGFRVLSEFVPNVIRQMVDGVTGWLQGKLFQVLEGVIRKVKFVSDAFFRLYDAVVGNSYVPDMVEGIAEWMAKLDAGMVAPALNATEATREAFETLRDDVARIMESLMTDSERAARQFVNDSKVIADAMASGILGQREGQMALAGIAGVGLVNDGDYRLDGFGDMLNGLVTTSEAASVRVVETFRDMADKTLQSFNDVAQSIRGGGFLDILGSVIGLGIQLGSVGAFGKGVQGRINSVPGRANGGMVSAGQSYLVGENRPEIFTPQANGFITPSAQGSGGGVAMIVPSPYFDVVVDGRVQRAAPSIAMSGASMAGVKASRSQSRRVR